MSFFESDKTRQKNIHECESQVNGRHAYSWHHVQCCFTIDPIKVIWAAALQSSFANSSRIRLKHFMVQDVSIWYECRKSIIELNAISLVKMWHWIINVCRMHGDLIRRRRRTKNTMILTANMVLQFTSCKSLLHIIIPTLRMWWLGNIANLRLRLMRIYTFMVYWKGKFSIRTVNFQLD